MKRTISNSNGFAVIELLLVVIAVTLIVGVGFYIARSTNKATTTLNNAGADSSQVVKTSSSNSKQSATSQPGASTVGDLISLGNKMYNTYFAALKAGKSKQQALATIKSDFSADAYSKLLANSTSIDPLTCTDTVPSTFKLSAYNDDSTDELRANASASGVHLNFTATDRQDGSAALDTTNSPFQVTGFSCPN